MSTFARAFIVASFLLPASRLFAQQAVILKSGDRLTGQLIEVSGSVWHFRHPAGLLEIAVTDIAGFSSSEPLGFRLADGSLLAGTVATRGTQLQITDAGGSVRLVAPAAIRAVGDPADLKALVPVQVGLFTPFTRFWSATAAAGFSDKSGNSRAQGISGDVEVTRESPRDRLKLRAGLNRERAQVAGGSFETTVSTYYGSVRADVFFNSRVFAFASTRQERDTFQDLDLRSSYNGGFGVQIVQNPVTDLRFSTSGGARVESYTSGGGMTVATLNTDAAFRRKLGPATLSWTLEWSPNVADFADYTFKSDAALTTAVYRGLGFRFGIRNNFDNTPQPGVKKHDMLVSTSLTYSIGR